MSAGFPDRALGKDARRNAEANLSTTTPMADTPQEHEPGTDVETDRQENRVDGSLILAGFPSELLVHLAETLGDPLALLVSKAHLSKAFCEAARAA